MVLINLRLKAIDLRNRGWSYNIIHERLGISKSTLSHWLREIPYIPNKTMIKRIRLGPSRAAITKQERRLEQIFALRAEGLRKIKKVSLRDLFFMGLGIYLGEGTKLYEEVRIINSDPHIIKVAMLWFRKVCEVPNRNFAAVVHSYPDVRIGAAVRYWSKITGIPKDQFERVQIDRRMNKSKNKRGRLPFGTVHLRVYSRGNKRFGVAFHRRIMGWIEASFKTLRV